MLTLRDTDLSIGLDPSLTGLAVCIGFSGRFWCRRFSSVKVSTSVPDRVQRMTELVADAMQWIGEKCELTDKLLAAIFIEGYGFKSQSANWQAELGGLLRAELVSLTQNVFEIPPTSLKRFTDGRGNATKRDMADSVKMLYGHRFGSDDEVDACALYYMGRIISGADTARCERQDAMIGDYTKIVSRRI